MVPKCYAHAWKSFDAFSFSHICCEVCGIKKSVWDKENDKSFEAWLNEPCPVVAQLPWGAKNVIKK